MKINFLQYSEHLQNMLTGYGVNSSDLSIFMNSSAELEQFLGEAMNGDSFLSSVDSSDIVFEDGEFVNPESSEENSVNITDVLNDFLQNDNVQNVVDVDGNGTLSIDEINDFLEAVESLDENPENISIYDVFSTMQSIEDGTFSSQNSAQVIEASETENTVNEINQNKTTSNSNKTGRSGRTGSDYNSKSTSSLTSSSASENLQSMDLDKLEDMKPEREEAVAVARDKVNAALSGESDSIQSAQADCEDKKLLYQEALKNDENITEEQKTRQAENQANIDSQEAVVNQLNVDIYTKEGEISDQKSVISLDESNIKALESSISDLSSQTSDDEEVKADIASKLSNAKQKLTEAKNKLTNDKATLIKLQEDKTDLENKLSDEDTLLKEYELEKAAIEAEISANCSDETKLALSEFKAAEENVNAVKESELSAAKAEESAAQAKLDELNSAINTQSAKSIGKEFSVNSLGNPEKLFESMGLDKKGLNYEVFVKALEGYNNLEDKGNGYLGIFDTTQGSNAQRYYLLDLNNFELVGQSELKTGSGNMGNIETANQEGSHATLSGFERVGSQYYSSSMGKNALRLHGLEEGINDNAYDKGTVVHYTTYNSTWGCKGFPPVTKNGRVDTAATDELMHKLFPENSIIFTYPTDEDYWTMSELYA